MVRISCNILSKMESKRVAKFEECDKDRSGITQKIGLEHMYMEMTKSVQIDAL